MPPRRNYVLTVCAPTSADSTEQHTHNIKLYTDLVELNRQRTVLLCSVVARYKTEYYCRTLAHTYCTHGVSSPTLADFFFFFSFVFVSTRYYSHRLCSACVRPASQRLPTGERKKMNIIPSNLYRYWVCVCV